MNNKTLRNLIVIIMMVLIFANSLYVFAITNEKTQITVENFEEFKAAIKDAKDGSVIEIKDCIELTYENDTTIGYIDKLITIKKCDSNAGLKINGLNNLKFENIIFDGDNITSYMPIIQIYSENISSITTFENCYFQNFNEEFDGAICIDKNTSIFNNCIFANNKSNNQSGHLNIQNSSNVSLNNCILINGIGAYGGAINISSTSICNIDSCVITNNFANVGGAIYNLGSTTIKGTRIYNNSANFGGSDIYSNNELFLKDSIQDLQKLYNNSELKPIAWIDDFYGSEHEDTELYLKLKFGQVDDGEDNTNDNEENDSQNIPDRPNISENDNSQNETETPSTQNPNESASVSSNPSSSNNSTEENSLSLLENMNPNFSQTFNLSNGSSSNSSNPVTMKATDSSSNDNSEKSEASPNLTGSLSNNKTESLNPLNQSFNFTFESQNSENNHNLIIIFISIQLTLLFVIFIILITQNRQNNGNRYYKRKHKHHRKH